MQNPQYPQYPAQRRGWWTKGKVAAVLTVIIVLAIAMYGVATNQPYLKEGSSVFIGFEQEMYKGGDKNPTVPASNQLTFPYSTIICQTNTSCASIFNSIKTQVVEVRQKATPTDFVWTPTGGTANTLTKIQAYQTYFVKVSANCTLSLASCLPH